jgi:hypothetical protein
MKQRKPKIESIMDCSKVEPIRAIILGAGGRDFQAEVLEASSVIQIDAPERIEGEKGTGH